MTGAEYWRWTESAWHADEDWRQAQVITAGIDVGSVSSQAVILADDRLFAYSSLRTGSNSADSALRALAAALEGTGLGQQDITYIVGTGYGRVNVPFANTSITEISCHARGAHHLAPTVRTILDMGGQDCKVIRINERGEVQEFVMNEKCAAGTGRGMEVFAELLAVPITEVGPLSLTVTETPQISSTCVIFAKSEAISLLNQGWSQNQVLAAYCSAMAERVYRLIRRIGLVPDFAITGGIAKNTGVVRRLEEKLGVEAVPIRPDSQIAGALGAALFARELNQKGHIPPEGMVLS
jgi:bzd-type benzoyl-CoA reductase Q subunit